MSERPTIAPRYEGVPEYDECVDLLCTIKSRAGLTEHQINAIIGSLGPLDVKDWATAAKGIIRFMDLHGDRIPPWAEGELRRL